MWSSKWRWVFIPFLALLAVGTAVPAVADNLILASPMTGKLVDASGAPVVGATVERAWLWGRETGKDTATTAADGTFAFDEVTGTKSLFGRLLPTQPNISQTFVASVDGADPRLLMQIYKSDFALHGEQNGTPLSVICDYEAEPGGDGSFFFGTCRPAGGGS